VRACSLMAKSSSRGAIGSVDERTSCDRSYDREELVDEMDDVLRALERRRGWEMELKRMVSSCEWLTRWNGGLILSCNVVGGCCCGLVVVVGYVMLAFEIIVTVVCIVNVDLVVTV
jgi:hypothetical protein